MLNFRDLSWGLHHDQPFFALQARGVDGTTSPHHSIEEMARAYVEEIRALRPRGPYLLAGYSGGGVVAFEMAQQLKALGEEVPLLVFFDTYHPQMPIRAVTLSRKLMLLRKEGLAYVKERALDRVARARAVRERIQIKLCVLGAGRCRTRCAIAISPRVSAGRPGATDLGRGKGKRFFSGPRVCLSCSAAAGLTTGGTASCWGIEDGDDPRQP